MFTTADLARGWLLKGESDLATARQMLAGPGPYDTACFHAQQCVEKFLKAIIALADAEIPRTHDLIKLQLACSGHMHGLDLGAVDLEKLTTYAIESRYDFKFWPEQSAALEAVGMAELARAAVLAVLPPEVHPPATPPGEI